VLFETQFINTWSSNTCYHDIGIVTMTLEKLHHTHLCLPWTLAH